MRARGWHMDSSGNDLPQTNAKVVGCQIVVATNVQIILADKSLIGEFEGALDLQQRPRSCRPHDGQAGGQAGRFSALLHARGMGWGQCSHSGSDV